MFNVNSNNSMSDIVVHTVEGDSSQSEKKEDKHKDEYLECECSRCGYEWKSETLNDRQQEGRKWQE